MTQGQTTELLLHFQQAVEASSDAIGMSTPEGKHYYQNEAFTNLFGLSVSQTDGMTGPPSTVYADETVGREVFATILKGDSWSGEVEMIGGDGQKLDILLRAYSIKSQDGTIVGLVGVHADITDRKIAEEALQRSKELISEQFAELESIYENIPVGISYVDTDLRYIRINKWLAELNGMPASEHIGRKVSDVIPHLSDVILPIFDQVIKSGCARINLELSRKTETDPNNTHYWLAGFYPLKSEDGTVQGVISVVEDITQRKQSERERDRLLRSLESKNKELESIVAAASHDMRSPLINAKGFAGEMKKYCAELQDLIADENISQPAKDQIKQLLDDYIPEALWFIDTSTSKAHALSVGLYKVSQFGRLETKPTKIDMDHLIKSVIATMKYQLDESDIDLTVDSLPDCFADTEQINQAFGNLIDNAIKYREPSRKGKIHISGSIEDGQIIYCVRDNGIGIAEYSHNKVFEIFHRLNPQGHAEGEGLGLSIVSRIVERANGKTWVQSELGKGSQFFIGLPRAYLY